MHVTHDDLMIPIPAKISFTETIFPNPSQQRSINKYTNLRHQSSLKWNADLGKNTNPTRSPKTKAQTLKESTMQGNASTKTSLDHTAFRGGTKAMLRADTHAHTHISTEWIICISQNSSKHIQEALFFFVENDCWQKQRTGWHCCCHNTNSEYLKG